MTCYSAYKHGIGIEEYCRHIELALEEWCKLRPYYGRWVRRMLGNEDAVELAILFHDIGKLGWSYICANKKKKDEPRCRQQGAYIRHELLGAYWAYRLLPRPLSYYVAVAVALHHEPMLLGTYTEAVGESQIHISTLYAALRAADLGLGCRPICSLRCASEGNIRLVENALDMWERGEISVETVVDAFRDMLLFLSAGPASEVRRKRAVVGGLLHLLVVADSRAAMSGRGGEGTVIARQSCVAEPA
jgi:CRISPR-associated endonuclease Cas3-HD